MLMIESREDLVRRVQLAATGATVHDAGSLVAGYRMTLRAAQRGTADAEQVARAVAELERFVCGHQPTQKDSRHGSD